MRKIKRISAILLAMMIVLTGIYLAPEQVQEVQAADAATTYVVIDKDDTSVTQDGVVVKESASNYETYANYLFAGWLKQDADTEEYVATTEAKEATHAKFVSRDTLSVKFQIASNAVTDTDANDNPITADSAIRFISSVDSLDYSQVGFRVEGNNYPVQDNKVFNKIASTMYEAGSQKEYSFSPKVVGTDSEYFFTAKYAVASKNVAKDYTVQAYWTTLDGTTVYGDARKVCVADNAVTTINMPVNAQLDSDATYTVTGLEVTNVEVLTTGTACSSVRLTIDGNVMNLPSATKITFNDGTNSVTEVYRNYYTTHVVESDSKAINADTTWYEVYKENDGTSDYLTTDHFVIASSADLYGLAKIVNGEDADLYYRFSGMTITLIRDVEINSGNADDWGITDTTAPDYMWNPIGYNDGYYGFRGIFDGDDNTIQGVYYYEKNLTSTEEANAGLFGCIDSNSTIKNLRLTNSYIHVYNGIGIGGIVGLSNGGKIQNVYSSATVIGDANANSIGQFVGKLINGITLENCWSDGKVKAIQTAGNGATQVGGFIGYCSAASKTSTVTDCLHTGEIESVRTTNYPLVGGFCGVTDKASTKFIFTNYLEAGKITVANNKMIGMYFGRANQASWTATFTNSYAAGELKDSTTSYTYVIHWKSGTFTGLPTATTLTALSQKTVSELFGENACWEKVDGEKPFILSHFKDIWEDQQN